MIKVTGSSPSSRVSSGRKAGNVDGAAFSNALGATPAPVNTASTIGGMSGVGSVDALMALQAVEDPIEKRRKAERRGRQMLDGLDRLKVDLLEGRAPVSTLEKLKQSLSTEREETNDPRLESVIDQIELRVEVELAKASRLMNR
mgnify:CR=1 FL=1